MRASLPVLQPVSHVPEPSTDLLRWPLLGRVLRWRRVRTATQLVLLGLACVVVAHGLFGPDLAPKNLATVLSWVHYRGLLIGALVVAGNAFCGACPMILVRDLGRRVHRPRRSWPRWLSGKRLALPLFVLVLFAYERFDLWALPVATAWLVIGYFTAALVVDLTFRGAAFCSHVCPLGQFNFLTSTLSPLEVRQRSDEVCRQCATADCVKGRFDGARIAQRGCELGLFLPAKVGNLDCTFCLDCVQACPHDNVALGARVPGEELADDRQRSVIGRLSRRADLGALALVFTFGALLNAFAMTAPAYPLEAWLARVLGTRSETLVLAVAFAVGLGAAPVALCGLAAAATRRLARSPLEVVEIAVRYAYALVPLGVAIWLAHYGFHLLTGAGTAWPVAQEAMVDLTGQPWLGEPDWRWIGLRPGLVFPFQFSVVILGAIGGLALAQAISERDHGDRALGAAAPWAVLILTLAALGIWILVQPMEMRGVSFG
jgi:polyferredoxin